ncbi:MAG: RAMP superfamily CRISPR-associated protein [Nanoarchaeota archaeon]|nr:RAMP superfamily CRISPR-associated protein [Nanoarchaeota archaeon]
MNKIFKVQIEAKTDFHTSKALKGSIIEAMVFGQKDGKYKAVIPGTSIKGLIRWEFERLWFGAHNVESCKITKKYKHGEIREICKKTRDKLNGNCPICDIFGEPNIEGGVEYKHTNLRVLDFEAEIENLSLRSRNAINRDTGETNVFSVQVVPAGTKFEGKIILTNCKDEWVSYIKNSLKSALNFGIGGSRSSGLGEFELLKFDEDTAFFRLPNVMVEKGNSEEIPVISGWKIITGKITTRTPAHFGVGKGMGTFHPTLKYIPGQQLRGMFGFYLKKILCEENLYEALSMAPSEERVEGDLGVIFKNALPYGQQFSALDTFACKKCGNTLKSGNEECAKCHMGGSKKNAGLKEVSTFILTKNPYPRDYSLDKDNNPDKLGPYHIEVIKEGQEFSFKCLARIDESMMPDFVKCLANAGIYAGVGGFKGRGCGVIEFSDLKVEEAADYVHKRELELKNIAKDKSLKMVVNSPMVFPAYDHEKNASDREQNNISLEANTLEWAFSYDKRTLKLNKDAVKFKLPLNLPKTKPLALGETKFGHWSLRKKDWLDRIEYAIAQGSAANVVLAGDDFERAAIFELFGLGKYLSMGYGDFYFCEVGQ